MQAAVYVAAGAALVAAVAGLADRRRARRRDLDQAGWVSWSLVFIIALVVALGAAGLALRGA